MQSARRAPAPGPWDPSQLASLVDWWGPDSYEPAVPAWRDKGPNGHDLIKVFANSPVAGVPIDGKATLNFEAAAALKNALVSLPQPFTVYAVLRAGNFDFTRLAWDGASSTGRSTFYRNGTTPDMVANAGANLTAPGAWRRDAVHAVRITADDATSTIHVTDLTGAPKAAGNMGTGTWEGITLGASNSGSSAWAGDIAEIIRVGGEHDAAAVEAYLLAKYPSIAKRDWTPVDVLMAGDSITVGIGSTSGRGMRPHLREAFEAADVEHGARTLRFVGSVNDACMDHFGVSGRPIPTLRDAIAAEVAAKSPAMLSLLIGTNDARNNGVTYDETATPAAYADLLANAYAADPALPVVVCTLPPMADSTANGNAAHLTNELTRTGGIVETAQDGGQSITVCDLRSAITIAHLADGVHPNDAGYALLAASLETAWRNTL